MQEVDALKLLLAEATRAPTERVPSNVLVQLQVALRELAPGLGEWLDAAQSVPEPRPGTFVETFTQLERQYQQYKSATGKTHVPRKPGPHHSATGLSVQDINSLSPADAVFGMWVRRHLAEPHGKGVAGDVVTLNRSWYERLREMALRAAQGAL